MKVEAKKVCILLLLLVFLATLLTGSYSLARYSSTEETPEGGYTGDFEYILNDKIVINSVEDFFAAIENGYNYIELGDELDNPLIVADDIGNIRDDLTIDLNGHDIQRNNRNPLLTVANGLTLTILDSGDGGSLYNPVGSVISVGTGGTLTVAEGIFESGPRSDNSRDGVNAGNFNEYARSSGGGWTTDAGGSISGMRTVALYRLNSNSYSSAGTPSLPFITPKEGTNLVNGNMYFDEGSGVNYTANGNISVIKEDTYIYYTFTAENIDNTKISSSADGNADYYYEYVVGVTGSGENLSPDFGTYIGYPVYENGNIVSVSGGSTTYFVSGNDENGYLNLTVGETQTKGVLVTVYVYNDDKASAAENNTYAAVKMSGGNLFMRSGEYYSYFGKENTYCVDATGGYMSVTQGSFYSYENADCVRCEYVAAEGDTQVTTGEVLHITDGKFYSEIGDTVHVESGRMTVEKGTFTKDASENANTPAQGSNGSAVNVSGGSIIISNSADFTISGSGVNGIYASSGASIATKDTKITFNDGKQNGYSYNYGIISEGGNIECNGATELKVTGTSSSGILATGQSDVTIGGTINCTVNMVTEGSQSKDQNSLSSTAVFVNGGKIELNLDGKNGDEYTSNISSDGLGIVVYNGNMSLASGAVKLATSRGTAVYLTGGEVGISPNATFEVESEIDSACSWPTDSSGNTGANIYNGIYIRGGSLKSDGTLNVTHIGVANDDVGVADGDNATISNSDFYYNFKIKSYAIMVEGSESGTSQVVITKGEIINQIERNVYNTEDIAGGGGGISVEGGNVVLGSEGGVDSDIKITTTGTDQYNYFYTVPDAYGNWSAKMPKTGGHAVNVSGGSLTVYNGNYTSALGNGALVTGGDVIINGGNFQGADKGKSGNGNDNIAGAAASYALKVVGGGEVNISGGLFGLEQELNATNYSMYSLGCGIFVMGTTVKEGNVTTVYKADFEMTGGRINVAGSTGLAVWSNADVVLGKTGTAGPTIYAESTGITAESTASNSNSTIKIYSGTYQSYNTSGGKNGIWYGEGTTELDIHNGSFLTNSSGGYGLNVDTIPSQYTDNTEDHKANDYYVIVRGGTFTSLRGNYTDKRVS